MAENINKEVTAENQTCPAVGYQSATICVPVTITPFAKTGITVTKCCGNATVLPGRNTCGGIKNGICAFTISQNICVEVPVDFGATATVGDTFVSCNGASSEDICTNCDKINVEEPINPLA
ncbi:MAG: hypothetical protein RR140_03490 [Clostridia bacterium]